MEQDRSNERSSGLDSSKKDSTYQSFYSDLGPITGESIMKSDFPLIPLVPAAEPVPDRNGQYYMAEYLGQFIGQCIGVQMFLGCGCQLIDRIGVLIEVGNGYIVLETCRQDLLLCDLDSVKFISIYRSLIGDT